MARFGRGRGNSGADGSTAKKVPFTAAILTALAALCIPIWLLAFLGWAVQLAGVAAVQYKQGRHFLQFDWFITALEFIVLLSMIGYLLARRSTPGIIALKAVVTVLEILRTNVWNNARLGYNNAGTNFVQVDSVTNPGLNASRARVNLIFAGYLITAAFNLLLLCAVGNLPALSAQDGEKGERMAKERYGQHEQHNTTQAQPFTTTAVAVAGPNETVTTVTEGPIYPGQSAASRV